MEIKKTLLRGRERGDQLFFVAMTRPQKRASSSGVKSQRPIARVANKGHIDAIIEGEKEEKVVSMESEEDPRSPIEFEHQILTPTSSLLELQQQSQVTNIFNAWINGLSQVKLVSSQFPPISNSGMQTTELNDSNSAIDNTTELMRIKLEDIEDEIVYWKL